MGFSIKDIFKNDDDDSVNNNEEDYYNISQEDALKEADKKGNKMILMEPRAFSEAQQIADHLKNRNSVVVNLKRVTAEQAKRVIDFLSGVVYAIGGSMDKIGVGSYLLAPKNVNVQGKISDDSNKTSKNNSDEDLDW